MNVETFFEKFELFADAPDAVAKIRGLVLRLAVRGQLVPQVSIEGNYGDCLRIPSRLDASGLPPLPSRWSWVRVDETGKVDLGRQRAPQHHRGPDMRPYLRVQNVYEARIDVSDVKEMNFTPAEFEKFQLQPGDVLLNEGQSRELVGRPAIYRGEVPGACFQNTLVRYRSGSRVTPEFALIVFRAYMRSGRFQEVSKQTTNIAHLSAGRLAALEFPLPPLAEQKRIVAKVDELMALCDRLEAQQRDRDTRRAALARAALARFAEAPTPASLDLLFHRSYDIAPAALRKAILTLAVQGKLIPQDHRDEPATSLVTRLTAFRDTLVASKEIRRPKTLPALDPSACPHDIPESWVWSRLGDLALVIDYGTSQRAGDDSSKVPVYRMGNISGGRLIDENLKYVDRGIDDLPALYLKNRDILFNRTNSYELVGKSAIFTGQDDTATFASYLIRIRLPATLVCPEFYSVAMNAPYFRETQIEPEIVQQCGQANFNGTKLATTAVPVPPLAEQRRIIAKVDQLMALIDRLEAQLTDARAAAKNLLDAAVAELTAF